MRQIRFIPDARREFLTAVAFYEEAMPGLGNSFVKAIEQTAGRTLAFPLAGKPSIADARCVQVTAFPFTLFYRPLIDGTLILAIARPSGWNRWGGIARREE